MRKFIRYYKNKVQSITQALNPFAPIFISKNDMQEKESVLINRFGCEFLALGRLFLQYRGSHLEIGKSHLHRLLVKDFYSLTAIKKSV